MRAIMRRLEMGERCWPAELVLRGFGLTLLGSCAALISWLQRLVTMPPAHDPTIAEFVIAALAVVCGALGCVFLLEGPALFRLVWVPARHWTN